MATTPNEQMVANVGQDASTKDATTAYDASHGRYATNVPRGPNPPEGRPALPAGPSAFALK